MRHRGIVDARLQSRVDRLENPAVERHEVRDERHRDAQLLLDLGGMPVREDAVGRDAVVALGEVRPLGRRLARARDAGLGVDDNPRLHEASRDERLQRQHRGRRIAPGARDEAGAREVLPVAFGQSVRQWHVDVRRMGIPALPEFRVPQAEGAGKIEDPGASTGQNRRDLGRQRLRDGEEDGIGFTAELVDVKGESHRVPDLCQGRNPASLGSAGPHRHPYVGGRVPGQATEQLDPGITSCPCDADPDAKEIIHRNE